jgi:hypothetical protein
MIIWLKAYVTTHLFYVVLIAVLLISGHIWLTEHDARVASDNAVKAAQVTVKTLQAQIDAIPAVLHQRVQVVTKIVHDSVTPSQVVAAVPSLTDVPLNTRTVPGNQADVEVAAVPLMQLVGELKTSQLDLGACQQTGTLKDQQLVAKDTEIVALKKKPKFLTRVKHVAEAVGVGIAVGLFLGAKL